MTIAVDKKIVYLLVGAKGSGKTYIGTLLEELLGICFIRVEQRLIEYLRSSKAKNDHLPNDGYDLELKWIDEALHTSNEVISEVTGSSKYLLGFLGSLEEKYDLRLVRIACPLELCLKRVRWRSQLNQFEVSDEKLESINIASNNVELDWRLEIDNSGPMSDNQIISAFNTIRIRGTHNI